MAAMTLLVVIAASLFAIVCLVRLLAVITDGSVRDSSAKVARADIPGSQNAREATSGGETMVTPSSYA